MDHQTGKAIENLKSQVHLGNLKPPTPFVPKWRHSSNEHKERLSMKDIKKQCEHSNKKLSHLMKQAMRKALLPTRQSKVGFRVVKTPAGDRFIMLKEEVGN